MRNEKAIFCKKYGTGLTANVLDERGTNQGRLNGKGSSTSRPEFELSHSRLWGDINKIQEIKKAIGPVCKQEQML